MAKDSNTSAKPGALTALVKAQFAGQFLEAHAQHGDETVVVKREGMLELFRFLRDDARCRFDMMIDLTAVDYLPRKPRFEMVYHLKSTPLHHRHTVRVHVGLVHAPQHTCRRLHEHGHLIRQIVRQLAGRV